MNIDEIVTNKIIECLNKGVIPWQKEWTSIPYSNYCTRKKYQGINQLLLYAQCIVNKKNYISPFWLTWNQLKKLKGYIRKNEKASIIVFYDFKIIETELKKPNGMIITTGPTGSGKTTLLYAFLKKVNKPEIKIITLENPIEYHLEGIEQTQVAPDKGYTFAAGLRSIVRQDPDMLLVGEIRDNETAETAIKYKFRYRYSLFISRFFPFLSENKGWIALAILLCCSSLYGTILGIKSKSSASIFLNKVWSECNILSKTPIVGIS